MSRNMSRLIFLIVLFLVGFTIADSNKNNESKLKDVLRNNTKSKAENQNNNRQDDGDEGEGILKVEAQKMLRKCDPDKKGNIELGDYNTRNSHDDEDSMFYGNSNNKNRNGYEQGNDDYGNKNYGNSRNGKSHFNPNNEDSYSDGDWNLNSPQNQNDRYNGHPGQTGSDSSNRNDRNCYGSSCNDNRNQQNGYGRGWVSKSNENGGSYGTRPGYQSSGSNNYDVMGSFGSDKGYGGRGSTHNDGCDYNDRNRDHATNTFGHNTGMTFEEGPGQSRFRRFSYFDRRDSRENQNSQCVSRCVFGQLKLLDDEENPSETAVIKWLQDHVTGNDIERIKTLRDTRKCFARMAISEIEDGCELSKQMSQCLELDLE